MPNFLTDDNLIPAETEVPSYLLAADNHNLGNTSGGSWFNPETWGQKFSNAGAMISVGMLSGANSFYNTGITIGNWFGANVEENDTRTWISGLDSDLGAYYADNKPAADLVGFIASSLLPGIAGIKVFNAGQVALRSAIDKGLIGGNLAKATGLLVPKTAQYVDLAAKDITAASATFSAINQNGIKALASGVWQNTLEAAAFETAVQATMFKSPILDTQDGWDIAKNIAIGGAVGGVIGGAFSGAITYGQIKRAVVREEGFLKPLGARVVPEEGLSPSAKIILLAEDRDYTAWPIPGGENYEAALKLHQDKLRRIENDIRTEVHKMTQTGDTELGNMTADILHGQDHMTILDNILASREITRVANRTSIESEIMGNVKAGLPVDPTLQTSYVKLIGEDAGAVSTEAPAVINLADRVKVKSGGNLKDAVLNAVDSYKFSLKSLWSALDLPASSGHLNAEARYIWADTVLKELPTDARIHQYDIPLLERARKDGNLTFTLVDKAGNSLQAGFSSARDLETYLIQTKEHVANSLLRDNVYKGTMSAETGMDAFAKIVNAKRARLEGTTVSLDSRDYFAWQSASDEYKAMLSSKGLATPANADADTRFLPTYAKVSRRLETMEDVDGNVIDGITYIKQQEKLLQLAVDNVVSKATGELYQYIPQIRDDQLYKSTRYGAGAKILAFANGGYDSLESVMQQLGQITNKLKRKFRETTSEALQGPLVNLGKSQEAAIEFETINQKVTRSARLWIRHTEEGFQGTEEHYLVARDIYSQNVSPDGFLDVANLMHSDPNGFIKIAKQETVDAIDAHIARTGSRTNTERELRAVQGLTNYKDPAVFSAIRSSPKDYPFYAFVEDPRVTGQGHMTMIHAASEAKLNELIDKVPKHYQVRTGTEISDYKRARDEYDYQRTLHESEINKELKNAGVLSNFFSKTDPQKIVNDILNQHLREDDILAIELMRGKNQKAFNFLEDQGDAYSKVERSKLGYVSSRIEAAQNNPYVDYIKTGLDISKINEYPLLRGFNTFLDTAVSRAKANVDEVFAKAKSPADLQQIDSLLSKYGMNTGYRDAALDLLANHTAPKGELTKFVRGANAILSKLTLGLDPLNAVTNFVGANILRTTELKQITDAINAGDTELAGSLGKLLNVKLPGVSDSIVSPGRVVQQAFTNFVRDDGKLLAQYKQMGLVTDLTSQFKSILEDFTLRGTETVQDLTTRLNRALAKAKDLSQTGEKITGNKFAEELNRFISADVMRQITDLGTSKGLITKAEQATYMNTFVNRVEGNTIASQRPILFQGPIGQAIGLFQSYQFNLMQQMFRYVAEGSGKDSAMLLGLQGTFFGIQGLPAFQFINQHIVGTLSGNTAHTDLYNSTYGILGKQLGDLALYGLPSNLLQANIYSRGDINPRQVTVLPTTLSEVPFLGAFGKFLGTIKDSATKIAGGGNVWETLLQGLEHNGLSRPLAGFAQTMQAFGPDGVPFSTSTKGSILFSNDLMSWATAARLAGGRPLDEAIINDQVFRIQAYHQYDLDKMNNLAEAIKSTAIQGLKPDETDVIRFAKQYAENGGKQVNFTKYMMNEIKAANTSQSQKIVQQLNHPFAQRLQVVMGGDPFNP